MYVQTDESGRVVAATDVLEYLPDGIEVERPDGFDESELRDWVLSDGKLVSDPLDVDKAYREEVERRSQLEIATTMFVKAGARTMTDAQALSMPLLFDEWSWKDEDGNPIHYEEGDVRRYKDGNLYRCRQDHDSQEAWAPDQAHSLWGRILKPGIVDEWVQPQPGVFDGYNLGDRCSHDGRTWESTYDGLNVWGPPGTPGLEAYWKEVTE